MRENRLDTLPSGVFNGLAKLHWLDLSGNRLRTLPEGVLRGLDNLLRLFVEENQLHSLPDGVFEELFRLAYLDLSNNNIAALPQDVFEGLGNLRELELWRNQLTSLPPGLFAGMGKLVRLNLGSNPGEPFAIPIKLRQTDATSYVVEAPLGIPVAVVAHLSATGGTLSQPDSPAVTSPARALSMVLPAGSVASPRVDVVPDDGSESVVVRLTLRPPPGEPPYEQMQGFELVDEDGRPQRLLWGAVETL